VGKLLLLILLLSLVDGKRCESASVQHVEVSVIDATAVFWQFWDANSEKPDSERVQAFFDTVVATHPDLFSGGVLGGESLTNRFDDPAVRRRVATYLHDVAPLIPKMRIFSNTITRDFRQFAHKFTITFPDYVPISPVYFTISLFQFDAGVRVARNHTAVFFGIDGIARSDGADASLQVIIDHELFHQYHLQIAPELTESNALWAYLWEEGLATFVSQRMNPGSTEAQVFVSPPNLSGLASPMLPALARELLSNFDSTNREELAVFFSPVHHRPDIPIRSGYYVGYRVAEKLAVGRSLSKLAALRGPDLQSAIRRALTELSRER